MSQFQASRQPYRRVEGIDVFIDGDETVVDHLDHDRAGHHKATQAAHFDRADPEAYEMTRPHGTPRLYRFFMGEKARRAIDPVRTQLQGATALVVCGGSGMDAEYLSQAGARVVSSDLSIGAAKRARDRSRRFGVPFESVVADVENLPYADQSVDLVAVHDGLHHLSDPYVGMSEMARVARRWVVITEPARAVATRLAVHIGLALEREEAGNEVARLDVREVSEFLRRRGFATLRAERYAMYYAHRPGIFVRTLSFPVLSEVSVLSWRLANLLVGKFGNKMVVVAERIPDGTAGRGTSQAR